MKLTMTCCSNTCADYSGRTFTLLDRKAALFLFLAGQADINIYNKYHLECGTHDNPDIRENVYYPLLKAIKKRLPEVYSWLCTHQVSILFEIEN